MNSTTFEKIGLAALGEALPVVADIYLGTHPGITPDQAAADIEGELKNAARRELGETGFLVDIVWPWVGPAIRADIAAALSGALPGQSSIAGN